MKLQEKEIGGLKILELSGNPEMGAVVLLHGFGADADDLLSISHTYKGPTWIFPQGPLQINLASGFGRAWFDVDIPRLAQAVREKRFDEISCAFPSDLTSAQKCVEYLIHQLDIPLSKIVLGGFSQGAVLAVETVLRSDKSYGGLLIFSGTLINEPNWKIQAPRHAKMPFFQSHGSYDHLLPLQKAQDLEKLLITYGLNGKLHSFPGGHEIPNSILCELSIFLKQIFSSPKLLNGCNEKTFQGM